MSTGQGVPVPNGLADPQAGIAYIRGSDGLIFRLDLASGNVWGQSEISGIPLALFQGMVIGWGLTLEAPYGVRLFAAVPDGDALRVAWEQWLRLPSWVNSTDNDPDQFHLDASVEGERLAITWEAHSRYTGGAPPPPGVESTASQDAAGRLFLNLQTGNIEGEESIPLSSTTQMATPHLPAGMRMVPYLQGDTWSTQPWDTPRGVSFLASPVQEPGIVLMVREMSGSAPRPVRLTSDPGSIATLTPDGRFLFIYSPQAGDRAWLVFRADTGDRRGELPFDPGTQDVAVLKGQVFYRVIEDGPGEIRVFLRSRDLESGNLMWTIPLGGGPTQTPLPPQP